MDKICDRDLHHVSEYIMEQLDRAHDLQILNDTDDTECTNGTNDND